MPVEIDAANPCGSYLEITFEGEWSGPDFIHFLPEVFTTIRGQKLRRVLLDFSEVHVQTRIFFEHAFGEFLSIELPRSILFAVVLPFGVSGSVACFESVACTQGPHLHVFASYQAATDWLEELEAQFAPDLRVCVSAGL